MPSFDRSVPIWFFLPSLTRFCCRTLGSPRTRSGKSEGGGNGFATLCHAGKITADAAAGLLARRRLRLGPGHRSTHEGTARHLPLRQLQKRSVLTRIATRNPRLRSPSLVGFGDGNEVGGAWNGSVNLVMEIQECTTWSWSTTVSTSGTCAC